MEIERKWVVGGLPEVTPGEPDKILQGYIAVDKDIEVRARKSMGICTMTVKKGTGLVREEIEVEIPDKQFQRLWRMTDGRRLTKYRINVPVADGAQAMTIDIYAGDLNNLKILEVEFPSVAEASAFKPPEWAGPEVTGDGRYSSRSLAEHGLP